MWIFFSIILGDLKDLANEPFSLLFISFLVHNNFLFLYFGFVLLGEYKLQAGRDCACVFTTVLPVSRGVAGLQQALNEKLVLNT